jgi:hypothetical protein
MPLVTIIARGGLLVQPTRHAQQILTAQTTYSPTLPLVEHLLLQCSLLLVAVKHSWVISGLISWMNDPLQFSPLHRGTLLFFEDKLAIEMIQRG